MIHPHTRIRYISDEIGYGVFATQLIPKGTIVYIKDSLELEIQPEDFENHSLVMQEQIEKYSYMNETGVRILSWDFAKYVNHCCNYNTLSSAYGFDIAIKDIVEGDEITCDYGLLNVMDEMELSCTRPECRKVLRPSDFENYYLKWDDELKSALKEFSKVIQPLLPFVENGKLNELSIFLKDENIYNSICSLRYKQHSNLPSQYQSEN
ncbi:MAG: SET domain-containing protein [Bacteroidetes bacterium]|nr:MAG: SET domain-containing protein [Bacteroidota bacterium]